MSLPGSVLVANRGEIASRIVRTLRAMEIESIVVFHPEDADGVAVSDADRAVQINGPSPVAAYLDIEGIVRVCEETGAEAVHPGFGFLAENADFAEAVAASGRTFIGPPPAAIRAMGDKIESKRIARASGVPTLPGSEGAVDGVEEAVEEAERIGYPVLLKASAGGGGKGMRVARNPDECRSAFEIAASEALAAFGDGRLLLERYLEQPRHVEIQVLADAHGACVHLGERECSIQRRYQKVIEEAPSPAVDEALRGLMGDRAVALARGVDYVSAGTVEMVLDRSGEFFFLEMNTRLQVEHPVTEMISGIDIVAEQVRIAGGEPLGYEQADVGFAGHAIEARVYAEDADAGFLPQTGTLRMVRFPSGDGVRVDHGVHEGQRISASFDPMIAKVAAHGSDREAAIEGLRGALAETVLLGTTTNTAYLARVLDHPEFRAGRTYTSFLDEHATELAPEPLDGERAELLAAAAALASPTADRRFALGEPHMSLASLGSPGSLGDRRW